MTNWSWPDLWHSRSNAQNIQLRYPVPFNIILRPDPESDPKQKPKPESGTSLLFDSNILFTNSVWVKNMVSKFLRLGLSNRSQREGANVWIPPGGGGCRCLSDKNNRNGFFSDNPVLSALCNIIFLLLASSGRATKAYVVGLSDGSEHSPSTNWLRFQGHAFKGQGHRSWSTVRHSLQ